MPPEISEQQSIKDEVASLERKLEDAMRRLKAVSHIPPSLASHGDSKPHSFTDLDIANSHYTTLHTLLLLADSALPLGSFAFSSGLESYLAHHKQSPPSTSQLPGFNSFLKLSLSTLANTALPYVLAAYREPELLEQLDNDFDASTPCTVARRASVAQGRALTAVWERSFQSQYRNDEISTRQAIEALSGFQESLRSISTTNSDLKPNAHLAPLWGVITRIMQLPLGDSAYLFLFSHARTVVSAAVRASVLGPYQAQAVLAKKGLQEEIRALVEELWEREVENTGQTVPVVDLWVGRHEKLYSRIFNS